MIRSLSPRCAAARVRTPTVCAAVAAGSALFAIAAPTQAREGQDRVTVLVAPAPVDDPALQEAALRTSAELRAAGFEVARGVCLPGRDPGCAGGWMRGADVVAAVSFVLREGALTVETRAARAEDERVVPLRLVVAALPVLDPQIVAVRSAELVRAGVLALGPAARPPVAAEVSAVASEARAPASPPPASASAAEGLGPFVELGPGVLQSVGGLGSAFGPELRGGLHLGDRTLLGARLLGPTVSPDVRGDVGTAELRSALGGLELGRRFRPGTRVRPLLTLGGGAFYLRVRGKEVAPLTSVTTGFFTPFVSVGAGVALGLGAGWALELDARALFLKTVPAVRIGGMEAGHVGWPLLGFGARLSYLR